jgi:hypothetical protein
LSNKYAQSISNAFNSGSNAISYPDTDIANQLKTVARLMSGHLETKVYMVRISGFDTHNAQVQGIGNPLGRHHDLLSKLSDAVAAFFNDLDQQQFSEEVVGLTFSEFGRKAAENGNFGTDHGEIAPMFVFGKAVKGGVTGVNPDLTEASKDNNYQLKTVQFDYRQTIGTLLQDFLGTTDNVVDAAFFNYSKNESFTNLKVLNLVKNSYAVSESCLNGIEDPYIGDDDRIWQVYPSPFTNEITIFSVEDQPLIEYQVFAMSGALIVQKSGAPDYGRLSIELGHLSNGIYLLKITSGDKKETHKIIKN